ncbi:MAG: carboxylating nicotinate-nucleotide diphosphorylase [Opitutales bacterium]|nr:carboxylating nicotinate-nucleotide diphosphorylase [Opitutales bacterium]
MKDQRFIEHLVRRLSWAELDENYLAQIVRLARAEDICGAGLKAEPAQKRDITTDTLTPDVKGSAVLAARKDMTLCGLGLIEIILGEYAKFDGEGSCRVKLLARDCDGVKKGAALAEISGPARTMIRAERVMLNFLQHLSGVATLASKYVEALGDSPSKILDTRKTTPCFRTLEKYAVACGGAYTHRTGLFDRVMLKDNHLASSGAVSGENLAAAVRKAKAMNPEYAVEVEVDSISQIPFVLEAQADVIMFDNFNLDELKEGVKIVAGKAWTEASGGITLETVASVGRVGVDFISSGALVHQSTWIDIGMDWL